ncbi:hypothetical protein [Pseudoalteromonas luteoviolacea]|uniref:Uncharacterized protein n=1 Tax=Pseudoalteromonas luteoviolacea NCIMB 1942 TaxID=1365253 RepID=A0A167G981_9GAMM|nr:hypothetical protein [Pseudoalteromonas luteoviolacea]KZN54337.1 hypothetical protein N482_05665 [Pseudoalteromonas luteoviolacea NCIMB 1942]
MNITTSQNNTQLEQVQQSATQKSIDGHAAFTKVLQDALVAKPENTNPDYVMPISLNTDYDEISEQAKSYYNQALKTAKELIDTSADIQEQEIQLYREVMIEIMDMPIEVKIEPHEVNQALLFGSLGIDFLEYKEAGIRIEMLNLAEKDVLNSQVLQTSDKEKLKKLINEQQSSLELQREEMLAGTFIKENTDHRANIEHRFHGLDFSS